MTGSPAFAASSKPVARRSAEQIGPLRAGSPHVREPVVVVDGDRLMTEVWRWTPAFLQSELGAEELLATVPSGDGTFRYQPGATLDGQRVSISQFFADVAEPVRRRWCMQQVSLARDLPALAVRLDYPRCLDRQLVNVVNLWLAAPGTKTFYLFPPESLEALYPGPLNTGAQHLSQVDLFAPDFDRHPLAARLRYRTATVAAGETLVLPAFWWHQVVSHDVAVSVNYWWRAHVRDCLCPGFMRQLLSVAVQDDLAAVLTTFEFGSGPGPDPWPDVAAFVRLLHDIGEPRPAVALAMSLLRAVSDSRTDLPASSRAAQLLAAHAGLVPTGPGADRLPAEAVERLVDDVEALVPRSAEVAP